MPKKPDMPKFDITGIVDNLKSMINPGGSTPEVDPSDAIGLKLAELSTLSQEVAKQHAELAKDFQKMNQLLNGIYKDLEQFRNPPAATEEKPDAKTEEKMPEEEKKEDE